MIEFRPATRSAIWTITGLISSTGGGKTLSAYREASGLAGDDPFVVIDTENDRGRHYADLDARTLKMLGRTEQFRFEHRSLKPPFRPKAYEDAILRAADSKFPVIVVDSFSHEWASEGGILEWAEEELTRMAGNDFGRRESCKMASWIKPKMAHKHMIQRLLGVPAHLILCLRAEQKTKVYNPFKKAMTEWNFWHTDGDDFAPPKPVASKELPNEMVVENAGWAPICEKNLPYELTLSFVLTDDAPGVPKPLKLQAQHRPFFPLDKPITEECGRKLAEWAAGGKAAPPAPPISLDQETVLLDACKEAGFSVDDLKKAAKVSALGQIPRADYDSLLTRISAKKKG